MSAIIRNIINQAYQLPGIISADEVADGTDSALALIKLNELLGQLNIDGLFPFSHKIITFPITTSKFSYTIGAVTLPLVADIAEERPAFINRMLFRYNNTSVPMNVQQFDLPDLMSRVRTMTTTGTPSCFAVNETYPMSEIYFDIMPSTGSTIQLIYNASVPYVDINTTLMVPPEYNEVLITGLSRKLCVMKQMPAESLQSIDILWKESINRIKSANQRNQVPVLDIYGGNYGSNILSFNAWGSN